MHDPNCQEALSAAQHLSARLFHCHDTRDFATEALCFAEDGEWLRKGETLRGRAQIVATLEKRPSSLVTMHVVTNVVLASWGPADAAFSFFITTYAYDDGSEVALPVVPRGPPSVGIARARIVLVGPSWYIGRLATDEWMFRAKPG